MKLLYLYGLLFVNFFAGDHSTTIEGVIVGKDDRPVPKVYVFVFPISLTVEHSEYKKVKLVIREPGTKQHIRLEQK